MADEHDDAMAWAEAEADKIADKDIKTRPFSELRAEVMAKRKAEADVTDEMVRAFQAAKSGYGPTDVFEADRRAIAAALAHAPRSKGADDG